MSWQESTKKVLFGLYPKDMQWYQQGRMQWQQILGHQKCQHKKQQQHEQTVLMVLLSCSAIRKLTCANSYHKVESKLQQLFPILSFRKELPCIDRDWNTSPWLLGQSLSHPGSMQQQGLQWNDIS